MARAHPPFGRATASVRAPRPCGAYPSQYSLV